MIYAFVPGSPLYHGDLVYYASHDTKGICSTMEHIFITEVHWEQLHIHTWTGVKIGCVNREELGIHSIYQLGIKHIRGQYNAQDSLTAYKVSSAILSVTSYQRTNMNKIIKLI
jgi:hypothetical protein